MPDDHYHLENAYRMHLINPKTFEIPTKAERDAIKPGTFLKVCVKFDPTNSIPGMEDPPQRKIWEEKVGKDQADRTDAERFWVKVSSIETRNNQQHLYHCTINNDLIYTRHHGLAYEMPIDIEQQHIYLVNL